MSVEYDYVHTDFANDIFNEDQLVIEIAAEESITTELDYIRSSENPSTQVTTVYFGFADTLESGEESALDSLVALHEGNAPTTVEFKASSKLIGEAKTVTTIGVWSTIGGSVTNPSFFIPNLVTALGRVVGEYKTTGTGGQLRIIEDGTTVLGTYTVPDSDDEWATMQWLLTDNDPSVGLHTYTIEGQKDESLSSFQVRYTTISLLDVG